MYVKEIIIIMGVVIIGVIIFFRRKLSDIGNPIDELRDNNKHSGVINKQTGSIIRKLKTENLEAGTITDSIRESAETAGDIFKQIRNQKLD